MTTAARGGERRGRAPRAVRIAAGAGRLSPGGWVRLLGVGALFVAAEAAVRMAPLPLVSRCFRTPLAVEVATPAPVNPWPSLDGRIRRWLSLTSRVGAHWPFGRGGCLRQALVEGFVLRRHRPTLRVGVVRVADAAVAAHAWIELAGHARPEDAGFAPLHRSA